MNNDIQTKRNKPTSANYRVLYAKAGHQRRLRAATTAELPSDIPNVSIGRALLVILLLHVLAIAAIYVHSIFVGNQDNASANQGQGEVSQSQSSIAGDLTDSEKIKNQGAVSTNRSGSDVINLASGRYMVVKGDNYSRIAEANNVDVRALRALNSNRPLRAGVVLDMPAELSVRPVDPKPADPISKETAKKPVLVKASEKPKPAPVQAEIANDTSHAPKALVLEEENPEFTPVSGAIVMDTFEKYTIKSGDTLWSLSSRFKVSREQLLKINDIKDPNKLYAGRTIKIPSN